MEKDLLIEIHVGGRPLLAPRITRVKEALAVGRPRQVAASRAAVDPWDDHVRRSCRSPRRTRNVAGLAAALRDRHRDERAVRGRDEPIDRGRPVRVEHVRIEQHSRFGRLVRGRHEDEERLLLRRLPPHREHAGLADRETAVRGGLGRHDLRELFAQIDTPGSLSSVARAWAFSALLQS